MRILLVTSYFPPEIGSAAALFGQLANGLAARGHEIEVVTGFPRYRMGRARQRGLFRVDQAGAVRVRRVASSPFGQSGPLLRGVDHLYTAVSLFLGGLGLRHPDVVLAYSPPLTVGAAAWALGRLFGARVVVNIQDLFPKYAVDIGLMTNPALVSAFERLEGFVYRHADALTVNTPANLHHLVPRGASASAVVPLYNWVDTDTIRPGARDTEFRRRTAPQARVLVQFNGTMGYQQDVDSVIEAAALLREDRGIVVQFVGDGVARAGAEARAGELGLDNVVFTDFQPETDYPDVLRSADISLVTLRASVETASIPSRLATFMAAGNPVIIAVPPAVEARAIVEAAACGIAVIPGEPAGLADAIRALAGDPARREEYGRRGRAYAEEHFSMTRAIDRYEGLFARLTGRA